MNKFKSIIILLALLAISPLSFAVSLQSMSKAQVQKAFANKTFTSIATDNLNGHTINNTFSMYLDNKGNIWGKMSQKPTNEPQTDHGVYSIKHNGTMNITWQHWDGKKQLCADYYDTQNAIIAISCSGIFHTVFMKSNIKSGNQLLISK